MASNCLAAGRIDEAIRYSDACQIVLARSHYALPHGLEGVLEGAYLYIGRPERYVEMCRAELRRRRDAPVTIRAGPVFALVFAGSGEEAMVAADGLIEAAEATGNRSCCPSCSPLAAPRSATLIPPAQWTPWDGAW
jgi:hypothetical protein